MVLVGIGRQTFDAKMAPIMRICFLKTLRTTSLTYKTIKQYLKITDLDI